MPIEDIHFSSLKINMTTSTKPIRQPKLTAWQQQNPHPGVTGREPEFIVKPANKWLREGRRKRDPKMLFDHFWYENELCILFADSNTGKSVLAVQIGDSISRGQPIGGLQMTAAPGGVLYFDYELSDKQFQLRYSNGDTEYYRFHKRFSRATANPQANKMYKFNGYQDYIENELENALLTAKAKVLIIDNISCLRYETNAATGATTLINTLRKIMAKYQISILLLAHTPKRNPASPITQHDLQGSKMLINFCDSAFAIGESRQMPGIRYLKQIKQRSTQQTYGTDNVCICTIKKEDNFLQFQFKGPAHEAGHLQQKNTAEKETLKAKVMELSREGMSIRKIAGELGLSASSVGRITKQNHLQI